MLTLDSLRWLQSADGQRALADLAAYPVSEASALREMTRLRAAYPPPYARALLEQTLLRQHARAKFRAADRMYFVREALEQATSEPIAHHRARRFAATGQVLDVCCGIGSDALALAAQGCQVTAIDRDPLRLALAQANAEALGLAAHLALMQADVLSTPLPAAEALFCDPARRAAGRRRFHVEHYEPPLAHVLSWRSHTPNLAVKLAPGVAMDALPTNEDYELECVSLRGELKEVVLWCGALATTRRRATLLLADQPTPDPAAVQAITLTEASPRPTVAVTPPQAWLYEPDPAIIRAGLVAELAAQIGATQLNSQIAYLTAAQYTATPFARAWQVHEWLPFSLKRLRARLRAHDAGEVTVKKRGSPLDPNVLARQLRGSGSQSLVVVLTRVHEQPAALICTWYQP